MTADNRPIGVFDSGVGGLTAVSTLARLLPGEDICYLGDTGRVPYGVRSPETIAKYARQDIAFLRSLDIKAIVVACGTVSATALDGISGAYPLPLYGVLTPTVAAAAAVTKNNKIGIIGTDATINSGAYQRKLAACGLEFTLTSRACPLFVPLVENGRVLPGDVVIETVVAEYLAPFKAAEVDTLILGCTHYPLLEPVIGAYMGPDVALISSGAAVAEWVAGDLAARGLLAGAGRSGVHRYYVTDSVSGFSRLAALFLREDVTGDVERVSLDSF